jgi:hypothetical protein
MTNRPNNGREGGFGTTPWNLGIQRVGIFRGVIFVAVLLSLFAIPLVLMVVAISPDSALHRALVPVTAYWFPLWAVFSVWVTLDASALFGFVGPRPDPLGPQALRLSALGLANIIAMFLFLIVTRGK